MAWNFRPDTVVRAGFATIFGRINGVNPILVPMLTPGLMQPATCTAPNRVTGGCGGTTPSTDFRVGVDGVNAPLPPPSANLPQPWYPGFNDIATGSGETIDPNFRPDRSDEFTLSVQHQFGPKILAEAGYIGRKLSDEIQYYSLDNVPYMMTQGGQSFAQAWTNIMLSTNYGTIQTGAVGAPCPSGATSGSCFTAQPFFEAGLGGAASAYCSASANCTAAFIAAQSGNMGNSDP